MMELPLAQMPTLDGAYVINLLSRVLHILAAIVLVGGIAYLRKVIAPAAGGSAEPAELLYCGRRKAWAKWVGIATILLLVTGIYNLITVIKTYPDLAGTYHMVFGLKFLLALAVFFLAAILAGKTSAADRFRQDAKKWLTLCLAAGIATVILASVLRSFHLPAAPPAGAPAEEAAAN